MYSRLQLAESFGINPEFSNPRYYIITNIKTINGKILAHIKAVLSPFG
jgi:hypothetical protein